MFVSVASSSSCSGWWFTIFMIWQQIVVHYIAQHILLVPRADMERRYGSHRVFLRRIHLVLIPSSRYFFALYSLPVLETEQGVARNGSVVRSCYKNSKLGESILLKPVQQNWVFTSRGLQFVPLHCICQHATCHVLRSSADIWNNQNRFWFVGDGPGRGPFSFYIKILLYTIRLEGPSYVRGRERINWIFW